MTLARMCPSAVSSPPVAELTAAVLYPATNSLLEFRGDLGNRKGTVVDSKPAGTEDQAMLPANRGDW